MTHFFIFYYTMSEYFLIFCYSDERTHPQIIKKMFRLKKEISSKIEREIMVKKVSTGIKKFHFQISVEIEVIAVKMLEGRVSGKRKERR